MRSFNRKNIYLTTLFLSLAFITFLFSPSVHRIYANCPAAPTNVGSVTATLTISETGSYKIWSRIMAADNINNSFWLQIDNGCAVNVGDGASIPANIWTWIDYQNGTLTNKIT